MNNRSKILVAILPVLACVAFLPAAQAQCVDGCNSNFGTFQGDGALINNVAGAGNTAFGWRALFFTSATSFNTAVGGGALTFNNSDDNVAVGAAAMLLNTSGADNVAVGTDALLNNSDGSDNNAIGSFALFSNLGGNFNNAHGRLALTANLGSENNAFGDLALESVTTGSGNTAIGDDAGDAIVDGSDNVCVGNEAGTTFVSASSNIAIGAPGAGPFADTSNTCFIGSIFGEPVSDPGSATAVFVDQFNVLGFNSSTQRVKHDVQPMDKASEPLFALKPVTFKYNTDKKERTQFGFIAEEVAQVNPDLVLHDKDGSAVSIRYEQINAMLLNEFLKEHKKVEEQQANIAELKSTVAQQQKGMDVLTAQFREQAAQIQKVSAQLEMNKPAAKVVVNKP
jgi:trimeric autotransporter adhesin